MLLSLYNIHKFFTHSTPLYSTSSIDVIMSSESINEYQFGVLMKANDDIMLQFLNLELDKVGLMDFKDIVELESFYIPIYNLATNMEQKRNNYRNKLLKKMTINT